MLHQDFLGFGDVKFLSENLSEPVDEERLAGGLLIESLNDIGCKGLADLFGILRKEFLNLVKREVWKREFVLDVEW